MNRGPSLEVITLIFFLHSNSCLPSFFFQYEIIHNPLTVDLLVSLAYVSASDGAMDEPLPVGLGLRVPPPSNPATTSLQTSIPYVNPTVPSTLTISADGLCEFDELDLHQVRIYSYLPAKDLLDPPIR